MDAVAQGQDIEAQRRQNEQRKLQLDEMRDTIAARGIAGKGLAGVGFDLRALSQPGPSGPALPAPSPGQPSVPAGGAPNAGPAPQAAGPGPVPAGMTGGLPGKNLPGGFNPAPMAGQPAPMSGGGQPIGGQPAAPQAPSGSPPPQPAGGSASTQPSPQPQGGGGGAAGAAGGMPKPIGLREFISSVRKANPDATPAQIFKAVEMVSPLLKQDEAAQWHAENNRIKLLDMERKESDFRAREDRLRVQYAEKIAVAKDQNEIKSLKNERDYQLKLLDDDRKRELGMANIAQRDRASERRSEDTHYTADTRRETAKETQDATTQRAVKVQEIKGGQKSEQIAQTGEEQRKTEGVKQEGRMGLEGQKQEGREILQSQKTVDDLRKIDARGRMAMDKQKLSNTGRLEVEALRAEGKWNEALLSANTKREVAKMTADQRKELVEYVEAHRDVRAQQGRDASMDRTLAAIDGRADIAKKALEQRDRALAQRQEQWKESRARLPKNVQENIERSENVGFPLSAIQREAKIYADTGDYSAAVRNLRGQDRNTVVGTINKYISDEMKLTPAELETNKQRFAARSKAVSAFINPNGQTSQRLTSLSVVQEHLDTWKASIDAYQPSSSRPINQFQSWWNRISGKTEVTDIDATAHVVAAEIMKAIGVRGGGGISERQQIAELLGGTQEAKSFGDIVHNMYTGKGGMTIDQAYGIYNKMQELINGQVKGIKEQARIVGIDEAEFRSFMTDRARAAMDRVISGDKPKPPPLGERKDYKDFRPPEIGIIPAFTPRKKDEKPSGYGGMRD